MDDAEPPALNVQICREMISFTGGATLDKSDQYEYQYLIQSISNEHKMNISTRTSDRKLANKPLTICKKPVLKEYC